ncbi:MAG: ribonuclease protein component [Verrucomicrobiota bacterium]
MRSASRKVQRLTLSGEYRLVREQGRSWTGRWLVMGVWRKKESGGGEAEGSPGESSAPRFGVVTSKRVGGAVVRNRVRRRIRHIHLAQHERVERGVWCVVVARFRASEASYADLESEWVKLAGRAGVLRGVGKG